MKISGDLHYFPDLLGLTTLFVPKVSTPCTFSETFPESKGTDYCVHSDQH